MAFTVTTLWRATCGDDEWCAGEYQIKERPGVRYFVAMPTTDPDVLAAIPHVGQGELVVEVPEV